MMEIVGFIDEILDLLLMVELMMFIESCWRSSVEDGFRLMSFGNG
jgi:hypothetical protein